MDAKELLQEKIKPINLNQLKKRNQTSPTISNSS